MRRCIQQLICLAIAATLLGCGSDDPENPSVDLGTSDDPADEADLDDLDSQDADGEEPDLAPNLNGEGILTVSSYEYALGDDTIAGHSVQVSFEVVDEAGQTGDTCTEREEGACRITTCVEGDGPDGDGSDDLEPAPHAGAVSVRAGDGEPVTLFPTDAGTYGSVTSTDTALFDSGDQVVFASAGDLVPAFEVTLETPDPLTLTLPDLPETGVFEIDPSEGLELAWDDADALVEVLIFNPATRLQCRYDAAAEAVTIPSAALAVFEGSGTFAVSAVSRMESALDGWQLSFSATRPAVSVHGLVAVPVRIE